MDSLEPPPCFDGTGFQRWKVLMEAHLQANGLNVWRVISEGMKGNSQQEKQYNAIAKCAILNSLGDNVFNLVFFCKKILRNCGKLLVRIMKELKMLQMKNIMFSLINLIVSSNLIMKMPKLCTHG